MPILSRRRRVVTHYITRITRLSFPTSSVFGVSRVFSQITGGHRHCGEGGSIYRAPDEGRERKSPMKALHKSAAEPGLTMVDLPEPTPGPNEVKIRVHRTGICGTDLHIE